MQPNAFAMRADVNVHQSIGRHLQYLPIGYLRWIPYFTIPIVIYRWIKLSGSRLETAWTICVLPWQEISMVELFSGKVYTLAVRPEITIGELEEEVKAFHPSEDEIPRYAAPWSFSFTGRS